MITQNPIPWRIFIPGIALLIGAVIYSIYWFVMAGQVEQNVALWVEDQRQRGYAIQYRDVEIKGYPYRFEAHFTDFAISEPGHPNDWTWMSEKMIAMMLAYRFNHVIFESQGQQRAEYIENLGPEARAPYRYFVEGTADVMRGSANIRDGRISRLSVDVQNFMSERSGDGTLPQPLTTERVQFHIRQSETDSTNTDVYIRADNIHVPSDKGLETHDIPIELIQAKLTLEGLQEDDLLIPGGVNTWLREGGRTAISDLAFTWDDAGIIGEGGVQLDKKARANGKISLRIYGHSKLIRNLVDVGALDRETGQVTDTALNLAALLNGGDQSHIDAPFEFKKGKVYLGPAQIGKLPPFDVN